MLNYQYALLEYGMLFLIFCDAVSEGDGERINRCNDVGNSFFSFKKMMAKEVVSMH